MTLKTYTHPPRSGGKPKSMVILLHGLGANGMDLLGLARYWEQALPDTIFLSPDAPYPCDMAPMGFQWFSLQDWTPASILKGVEAAAPVLQSYIDEMLVKYGLSDDRLALAGFSQGTMMALYTGPRRKNRIAGVLGYSGALVGAETLAGTAIHRVPVHLIHGDVDMVVPLAAYRMARDSLTGYGFAVTGGITRGLAHGIDDDGVESGVAFLSGVLAAEKATS